MKTKIQNIIDTTYKEYGLTKDDLSNQVLNVNNAIKKADFFNGSAFGNIWQYTEEKLVKTDIFKYKMSRDTGLVFAIFSRETGPLNYRFYTSIIKGQIDRKYVTSGADVHKDGIAGFDFMLSGGQKSFHVKNFNDANIVFSSVNPSEFKSGKTSQRPARIQVKDFTFSAFSMIAFSHKRMREEISGFDQLSIEAKRVWVALFFAGSGYAKHMIKTINSQSSELSVRPDYNLITEPTLKSKSNWLNTNSRLRNARRIALKAQVFEAILFNPDVPNATNESTSSSFFETINDFINDLFDATGVVTASSLRVRSGPGLDFEVNGKSLPRGTKVEILELDNGWYRIGEKKWIFGDYVDLDERSDQSSSDFKETEEHFLNDEIRLSGNVGFSDNYANTKEDVKKVQRGLNSLGFDIKVNGTIRFYYYESNGRRKLKAEPKSLGKETITAIHAFQHYFGLKPDGKISRNGETIKRLNKALSDKTKIIRDFDVLSKKSSFPKSNNSNLIGIDRMLTDIKGYTVPENYFGNTSECITNLEIIADEVKGIRVSSGYRSPEHNATTRGKAEGSFHMYGIAADLVPQKVKVSELHRKILKLISDGRIKAGGVGVYGSFVHYDIRGTNARW
ncbi:SH3 domain-containing protein [Aureisphaera galaxeae]|uniref:SH3 domain-containing protein n=1 Tax=Aureisphaera galaxeae TaxID=1538023 RepID=UPI00234FC290|nr:SH3 domain-containing protein [Aureisphaera galaxeae]MDC8005405.1 SH3 domain-containing protein [Aureisphaera galaxeae]